MLNINVRSKIATVIKAMAYPTRLFLMQAINEQEHGVCDLVNMVGAEMFTISRHLSILKNAGIGEGRKQNNQVFYQPLRPCLLDIYTCVFDSTEK
ncbi:hypothetical protein MASR1M36_17470 [Candidatus Cloacimonadaceae bacterium]